jgi:vacuolar-type H+-ATPase subunit I/STV1
VFKENNIYYDMIELDSILLDASPVPSNFENYSVDNGDELDHVVQEQANSGHIGSSKVIEKTKVKVCEVLLRHHSSLKKWYKELA